MMNEDRQRGHELAAVSFLKGDLDLDLDQDLGLVSGHH